MAKRSIRVEADKNLITPARRHWSPGHARSVLAAWRKSGLSMTVYARRQGVNAQRLSWWRKRLGDAGSTALAFIPAVVGGAGAGAAVTVRLPRGIEIEAADVAAMSPAWLAAVVDALERKA